MKNGTDLLFEVETPLKFSVSITKRYWDYIISIKHPHIKGMESDVVNTLEDPDFIRQSKVDENVLLFYREVGYQGKNYHMCVGVL
jgi:hypothetical protein